MSPKAFLRSLVPAPILDFYHYLWAFFGALRYGLPGQSKQLKIIGVTGTSGKSTTVDFVTRILEEAGHTVASISSVRFRLAGHDRENKYKMTMPGRMVVQHFLRSAIAAGCDFVVLEVTSEGIKQSRHAFINFDTVVFTNLSPEHIESHGGFENYRNEKLKLFKENGNRHIINAADENARYFLDVPAKEKNTFTPSDLPFAFDLPGIFNKANAACAVACARAYGITDDISARAMAKVQTVPGRMEIVGQNPVVAVDYAHTPAQLEQVYQSFPGKRLVCVLGSCGGGRDKWKRPVLGQLAAKYCDRIFITNEDPYDEAPMDIINAVAHTAGAKAEKILDRKEAIIKAIQAAGVADAVVITGKGSEPWMCVANGKKIPWDDRQLAREALQSR